MEVNEDAVTEESPAKTPMSNKGGDLGQIKGAVMHWVQKDLGKPTTKSDVAWSVEAEPSGNFKATCSVPHKDLCTEGYGESKKDAEAAAGQEMLDRLGAITPLPAAKKQKLASGVAKTTQKGMGAAWSDSDPWENAQWEMMKSMWEAMMGGEGPDFTQAYEQWTGTWGAMMGMMGGSTGGNSKVKCVTTELARLKDMILQGTQKNLKPRALTKADIVYDVVKEESGFVCTIQIPNIWDGKGLSITGPPAKTDKLAQEKAAASVVKDKDFAVLLQGVTPKMVVPGGQWPQGSMWGMDSFMWGDGPQTPQQTKALGALEDAMQTICYDFFLSGKCEEEGECKYKHISPEDFEKETAHVDFTCLEQALKGTGVKPCGAKRTAENKAECKNMYEEWRSARMQLGSDPEGKNVESFDCWYAQLCLVCLCELQLLNWKDHKKGSRHAESYKKIGGAQLLPGIERLDPLAVVEPPEASIEHFCAVGGWAGARVLEVGEQDYSFAVGLAKHGQKKEDDGAVNILATSYLAAHDPDEPEVHVRDDGDRQYYRRKSLPGMEGALLKNIKELEEMGGKALHSVDATDLEGTLRSQGVEGQFDVIVFPFPRASLKRGLDPRNSWLLRGYFRSVVSAGLLAPGGKVQLLLLPNQYGEWDTACMAHETGFKYVQHVLLPTGFYQSREMSGKPWKPETLGAGLYVFEEL